MRKLELTLQRDSGPVEYTANIDSLVIAGWTARDREDLERHIQELEALGVRRPSTVPLFYRVSASLLAQEESIEVVGPDSSGEAEPVVLSLNGEIWVGIGSDHTDRRLEALSVPASKQACPKPLGRVVWPLNEVEDHWDKLVLRSYIVGPCGRELYQEGSLARLRSAPELIELYANGAVLAPGTVMFCGTLPVRGTLRGAQRFEFELEDPQLGRTLRHAYQVTQLPIVS